jgi:hypothetical protein
MKCTAHTAAGNACKLDAIRGALVCHKHGGSAPHVKANAAVRAEVMSWGLNDALLVDPGETLLKLVSQSAARAQRYAVELEQLVDESDTLRAALVAQAYGEFGPVGEYVRGLVTLEAQERERCANWATKAIAAGLAERQVRLAEKQGALLADFLRGVLADPALGLTDEQRRAIPDVAERHLALVS